MRLASGLLVLAACLGAAETADPALALRLSASGPALATAAAAWRGQEDALLARFGDPDPARRRGAARLAAALPVEAGRLAAALAACPDREVRRLGAGGLRGADLAPAKIAALDDAVIAAVLVADHPGEDPLADTALGAAAERWLSDPATCAVAARMIAARGSRARWGTPLVAALGHADARVVAAAHGALQGLTRTQRSLDAYGGDRALLAQDWRDSLAAAPPAAGRPDPELMALVAELPAASALTGLLARGLPALAAIEQAQNGASRQRRHELEAAARLLAHEIPATMWTTLGAAAFAGLDDPDPQVRIGCLRALVADIRGRHDADGLRHLVAWLDDRDSGVRATALDLLVRLSDEADKFTGEWKVEGDGLFPPERTLHRLRRCLREGGNDEQIAGLLLVGTLKCSALADEVMTLVVSPRGDVATTALETLTRVDLPPQHIPTLDRLAAQATLARPARLAVIKVLGKMLERSEYSGNGRKRPGLAAMPPLVRLINDPDPRIALAAVAALAEGDAETKVLRTALDRLVARGLAKEAVGIASDKNAYPFLVGRVLAGQADAETAAFALAGEYQQWKRRDRGGKVETGADDKALAALLSAPPPPGAAWAGQAVLAAKLALLTPGAALVHVQAAEPATATRAAGMLATATTDIAELRLVATLADRGPAADADRARTEVIRRAIRLAGFSPHLLGEVVRVDLDLLGSHSTETDHDSSETSTRKVRQTVVFEDGTKLKLVAERPAEKEDESWSSDELIWTPDGPPPAGPDEAQVAAVIAILEGLHPAAGKAEYRDLAVAWMARREPAPALAAAWQHEDELCRILAARSPAFAAAVRAQIVAKGKDAYLHSLRPWMQGDDGPVIAVAIALLAADRSPSEWEIKPVVQAMSALPPARISALLPQALAIKGFVKAAGDLIGKAGPLPLEAVLALLGQPVPAKLAFAPIPADAADAIHARLATWIPDQVLARAEAVRRLRAVGKEAVDAALVKLVATPDPTAAAWLRSGIPLEAGLVEAYRRAEASPVPALALVGSVFAFKEGRLAPAGFLDRVGTWPPEVQNAAAAAAQRYLTGHWDGLAAPAAALVGKLGARALAAWIALLPADAAITAALAARAADPATADAIGGALMQRLTRDQAAWQAPVRTIAAAAAGRLDWLLGRQGP